MTPATAPITIAAIGVTKPAAGVIATSPATAPEAAPSTVGLPRELHSVNIQARAAAAAAVLVVMKAWAASPLAASALPALNPNQPNQSRLAPITVNGRLCGGIGWWPIPSALADDEGRRERGDARGDVHDGAAREVQRAQVARASRPCPRPSARAGRTRAVAHSRMKTMNVENFLRSANAPVMRAGVMTANIIWKSMKAWCGMVAA